MKDLAVIKDWITLSRAPGLGAISQRALLERFGGVAQILAASHKELTEAGVSPKSIQELRQPDSARIDPDLAWLEEDNNHLLTWQDPDYPPLLRDISDPPMVLYVHGDPMHLWSPQVAVVGSRNPTEGGKRIVSQMTQGLVPSGLTITSGLALGIDAEAHRAALEAGGTTVAVMGTGLDQVYPARNRDLAHAIAGSGALVSEFAIGTPVRAGHFPSRNRIISGLSLGTLVIEAALRSGSLITARLAGEQGREIFAVPGSIRNALARGCHRLIREGATLVENPGDVVTALAPLARELGEKIRGRLENDNDEATGGLKEFSREQADPDYVRLLKAMGHDPVSVDYLVATTGLTPDAVSSMLLILELEGKVHPCPGGRFSRL